MLPYTLRYCKQFFTHMQQKIKYFFRALRLPFVTASLLPFLAGSLLAKESFLLLRFSLGILIVLFTHLGANMINDYADARSGLDWQDKRFFGFFGGSKLIQENIFSENFFLYASLLLFLFAFLCVTAVSIIFNSPAVVFFYLLFLVLAVMYSLPPLSFSYHKLGELVIFVLFGPVSVMGGYYIQTQIFPHLKSFFISLPFGFFTTAILFANEVADYPEDKTGGKSTWASLFGPQNSYKVFFILYFLGFFSIGINMLLGYMSLWSIISLLALFFLNRAKAIIRSYYFDKTKLLESSRLTIRSHLIVGLSIILGIL